MRSENDDPAGAILDAITRMFWRTDHHEWEDLVQLFTERVRLDYTSLEGGNPGRVTPAELVAGWQAALEPLDAHQHLVTNQLIRNADGWAEVTASFQAIHQYEGDTWSLGGDCFFELTEREGTWLISSVTMVAVWQTGDHRLMARAAEA